jgi:hypothetical protein
MVAASVVAAFQILKPVDENGREYTPKPSYSTGLLTYVCFDSFCDLSADGFHHTVIQMRSNAGLNLVTKVLLS